MLQSRPNANKQSLGGRPISFSRELKDFAESFQAGYKLLPTAEETARAHYYESYAQDRVQRGNQADAQTRLINAQAKNLEQGIGKPAAAETEVQAATAEHLRAQTAALDAGNPNGAAAGAFATNALGLAPGAAAGSGATGAWDSQGAAPTPVPATRAIPAPTTGASDVAPVMKADAGQGFNPAGESAGLAPADAGKTRGVMAANTNSAHQSVVDGLTHAATATGAIQAGQQGVQTPQGAQAGKDYITGTGTGKGADPRTMVSIHDKVKAYLKQTDPDGVHSEAEINFRALGLQRDYFLSIGKPDEAKKSAADMLQYYRAASSQSMTLAQAAASAGHLDTAVKMAVRGYAEIPDGKEIKVAKNDNGTYTVTAFDIGNEEKSRSHTIVPADQMYAAIMKWNPVAFDEQLASAAGERQTAAGNPAALKSALDTAAGGGKPTPEQLSSMSHEQLGDYYKVQSENAGVKEASIADQNTKASTIGTAMDELMPNPKGDKALANDTNTIKDAAMQIEGAGSPHATANVAYYLAKGQSPDGRPAAYRAKPDGDNFKVEIGRPDPKTGEFVDGSAIHKLTMPATVWNQLQGIRATDAQLAKDKQTKDTANTAGDSAAHAASDTANKGMFGKAAASNVHGNVGGAIPTVRAPVQAPPVGNYHGNVGGAGAIPAPLGPARAPQKYAPGPKPGTYYEILSGRYVLRQGAMPAP